MDASFVIRLIDQVSGPGGKVKKALGGIKDGVEGLKEGFGKSLKKGFSEANIDEALARTEKRLATARSRLTTAIGTGLALAAPVKMAADFEDSFADLKKVLDAPAKTLETFRNNLLSSTALIPVKAAEMTQLMAEAAQGGVPVEELERFTKFTAKAAVAFDMAAGEIGERFAKLRNVFKLNQDGIEDMADAANHLSNNMAAKASEITNFTNRAAGAANVLKLTVTEMEAVGAAMIASGIVPETAARGFSALANKLAQGTPKVKKALKSVGIDYKSFMKSLDEDSTKALVGLFEKLSSDDDGMNALIDLVGSDFSDDFAKLMNNPSILAKAFELVGQKARYSGSAVDEFDKRSATTLNQFQLLKNKISAAGINIGNMLLPPLNDVMDVVGNIALGISDWTVANPGLADFVTSAGGLALSFTTAWIAGDYLIQLIRGPMIRALSHFVKFDDAGKNISTFAKLARGAKGKLGPLTDALGRLLDKMGPIGRAGRKAGSGLKKLLGALTTWKGMAFVAGAAIVISALVSMTDHHKEARSIAEKHAETYARLRGEIEKTAKVSEDLASKNRNSAIFDAESKISEFEKDRNKAGWRIEKWLREATRDVGLLGIGGSDMANLSDTDKAKIANLHKNLAEARRNGTTTVETYRALHDGLSEIASANPKAATEIKGYLDHIIAAMAAQFDLEAQKERLKSLQSGNGSNDSNGIPIPRPKPKPIVSDGLNGDGKKDQQVKATIAAEVIDKRPPNVTVHAPITVNEAANGKATAQAVANKLGSAVAKAKQGAMHGGTE